MMQWDFWAIVLINTIGLLFTKGKMFSSANKLQKKIFLAKQKIIILIHEVN